MEVFRVVMDYLGIEELIKEHLGVDVLYSAGELQKIDGR